MKNNPSSPIGIIATCFTWLFVTVAQGQGEGIHGPWIAIIGLMIIIICLIVLVFYMWRKMTELYAEIHDQVSERQAAEMALRFMEEEIDRRKRTLTVATENGCGTRRAEQASKA